MVKVFTLFSLQVVTVENSPTWKHTVEDATKIKKLYRLIKSHIKCLHLND